MPNVIDGTNGPDVLTGTPGDDIVTGGRGDDVAFMGAGDDVFVWRPGDGSDAVEGQAGFDTLDFLGSNASESIDISANGSRVRFFRNVANVTMDLNGVERVQFSALGGADNIVVNDLSGTDMQQVDIDLAGTPASPGGDGQADSVILNGANVADTVTLTGNATALTVTGLPATIAVANADAGADRLLIQTLAGNDRIDASAMPAGIILTLDGGAGDDTVIGGNGDDVLIGGGDNDTISGGRGNDVAFMSAGDDVFTWAPGDGSDAVEGQAGFDTLDFLGSNASETIDISANGSRVRLFRDVANVTMDLNGVERIQLSTLGGNDIIDASAMLAGIALTLDSGTGADTLIVGSGTLSADNRDDGGDGFDTLILRGPGMFDLRAPASLTGIEAITAREGQAAFAAGGRTFPAQNQLVLLRDGLDATVNVSPAAPNPANPKPATITIVGAHNAAVINLGSGNDTMIVDDARETVRGGSGDDTIQVNSATIGATIDGGTGSSRLMITGGGVAAMGDSITRIPVVFLAPSAGNYDFTANGTAGLTVTDLSGGADTLRAGGFGQTLTGGGGNDRMVGFSGGGTTFLNSAAAFNNDTISGLLGSDAIRITDMGFPGLVASFMENGSGTAGVLALADGVRTTSLTIEGSHRLSDFQFSAFGTTGTSIALQP